MLVLSRKVGETIVIGQDVTVKVLRITGGIVRLGVAAPDEVTVDRAEVSKRRQNGDGKWLERLTQRLRKRLAAVRTAR